MSLLSKFKHKNFRGYFTVGILTTILSTLLLWAFVDVMGYPAWSTNFIVVIFLFILKYLLYDRVGMLAWQN